MYTQIGSRPLVRVTWLDPVKESGWVSHEDAQGALPRETVTVGIEIASGEFGGPVRVAGTAALNRGLVEEWGDVTVIPLGSIIAKVYLLDAKGF